MCTPPLPAAELGMHFSGGVKGLVLPGLTSRSKRRMGAHAGVTLSHTHGTTCAYKQRSGGVRLKLGWPTWKSYGLNKQAVATLVIVSRLDAHSITFLLQIATLPRLCCSTTLSLLCVAALQCLACFCRAMPLAPPSLANSLGVGGGAHCHDTLPSHMLCERAHLVQGQHGYQALVWAAMGAALVLWVMPQDQCWPNSSSH